MVHKLNIDTLELSFLERTNPADYEAMRFVTRCWNQRRLGISRRVEDEVFWKHHNDFILHLCRRGWVLIATLPGRPDDFCGFLVGSSAGLDFGFTKSVYRRDGVFSRLVAAAPTHEKFFTHPPVEADDQGRGEQWWLRKFLKKHYYQYNPFQLLGGISGSQEVKRNEPKKSDVQK